MENLFGPKLAHLWEMKVHFVTVKVRIVGRAHALIEPAQSKKNYTKKPQRNKF
jgi:hypothetical protein